ncbi:hypothetical protein CDL12_19672 [Handroanthus impetiginosus]|uniref:KIB1-4 beta-propeller domain-containing protein n=1 Tax=Handroanthus impetiginosus TaxID=429701 RepID=A0A2G9GR28_9LAMI|nr:hypothetical protein CDL12_19672 [Handroanthus impetiginosus]
MENTCSNFFSFLPKNCGQTHPWLLVSQGKYLQSQTFCNISKHEYIERDIPEFWNKQVSATSYGWLVLIDYKGVPFDCSLVNTTSKERIQLPSIECIGIMGHFYQCILSNPPTDSNCQVLLITCSNNDYFKAVTNFMGKLYAWMGESGNFVEVDFVGQDIVLNQIMNDKGQLCRIPCPSLPNSTGIKDFLVESCGELLLCEELRNTGDRAIFLCHFGSMSLSCTNRSYLKRNSIYYARTGTNLCVYDIEDRSKTLLKLCPCRSDFPGLNPWLLL